MGTGIGIIMISSKSDKDRKFDKARELKNSTLLKKYKVSNYPEVTSVVDYLYDEMVGICDLVLNRKSSIDRLKHHIEFFVLNLYKTYCNDPTRVIAYSRDRNAYTGKKSRYKHKFGLSFRYSVDSGKDGKPVIGFLLGQDYIKNFSFQYDKRDPRNRYRSRMRATSKLIELIEKHQVSVDEIIRDSSDEETIVVKGLKPKPVYIPVIKDGKKRRKKIKRPRKVCKTPDKPIVREMRKNLEIINKVMDKAEITLDISEEELRELNARMQDDPDPYKQIIDFSRKRLHRVFLDRRLDRGGRFYGPWYQNIFKEYRKHITIDGAPTLELDYSALHPNLLYYYAKVDPPEGDLYELEGYSDDTRNFMKAMFLRLINSPSPYEAKGSIKEAAFYVSKKTKKRKKRLKIPAELGNLEDKYLDPLIDKFLEKHKALKGYIFKVKDLGNILQYVDSMIAEKVLLYFALEKLPVLPLHDSFRIFGGNLKVLEDVMNRIIVESFGRPIPISDEGFVTIFEKSIDVVEKVAEQIQTKKYDKDALDLLIKDLKNMSPSGRAMGELFERIKKRIES